MAGPRESELTDSARGERHSCEECVVDFARDLFSSWGQQADRLEDARYPGDGVDGTGEIAQLVQQMHADVQRRPAACQQFLMPPWCLGDDTVGRPLRRPNAPTRDHLDGAEIIMVDQPPSNANTLQVTQVLQNSE